MGGRARHEIEIEGRKVALSNLEKLLYPSGFTKGQVIDYYARVSRFILPHLKDRPVTLVRFPDGVGGEHFYEKAAPKFTPEWVRTFPVPRREGGSRIPYIVIDDPATLVWCANLAALELHPFLHRAPAIGSPTAVVFDLDPGDGTDILTCAEVGFRLKEALEGMRLESFPKVSGSKGIQLYVPLNTPVTYTATRRFARGLAQRMEQEHGDLVVSEMSKSVRKGRVFIDWSQNSDFKTTVAVYSLRAKQDRPYVSLPVKWEELRRAVALGKAEVLYFEPEAALKRVEEFGDLFAAVQERKQKVPDR